MKTLIISLLAVLILTPAIHATELTLGPQSAWWGMVKQYDGDPGTRVAESTSYIGAWSWGNETVRGFLTTNHPGLIAVDYVLPLGVGLKSASVTLNLTDTLAQDGGSLAGVHAYWVLMEDDIGWGGNYSLSAYSDIPVIADLGMLVPAGVGDEGLGNYTLDVTDPMQWQIEHFINARLNGWGHDHPYGYIRLQVEGENGNPLGGVSYYVFDYAGVGFTSVLTDDPNDFATTTIAPFFGATCPTPEPSVMAIGLVALLGLRRKK